MIKLKLVLIGLICCFCLQTRAQVVLEPLTAGTGQVPAAAMPARDGLVAIALPVFDDFSLPGNAPDPSVWVNGGVTVSSRFSYQPVSRKVATFDGMNVTGRPYMTNAVGAGPADTLTSQPILLGNLQPSDSVYLSFYWQSGGMGDVPDLTAENAYYLQLEFKDASGVWRQVWRQSAVGVRTDFAQVYIGLKEARYFHNDFQFRFRNIGDRSGMLDIWNLDYVELNRNRRKGQNTSRDFTINQGVSRLLKNYTAMPARQFLANPQKMLHDSVWVTINKLGDLGAINWRAYIKLANNIAPADTFLRDQGVILANTRSRLLKGIPRITNLALQNEGFVLEHGFKLNTSEQNSRQRANDTVSRKTVFADYFALDDGTAEAGFNFVASSTSHVAQRFEVNEPDQVRSFQVYFPLIRRNLSNTRLTFRIWSDDNGKPGISIYQQEFQIQHSDKPDTFYEVELNRPVFVEGNFFVGWSQPANSFINIGFDRNEDAPGQRFLWNNINNWQTDSLTQGAVMMRPVMSGQALGIEDELEAQTMLLYPNPSKGEVYVAGSYKQLKVFDVLGREVYQHVFKGAAVPLNLSHLPGGAYIVHIETLRSTITKKLILTP